MLEKFMHYGIFTMTPFKHSDNFGSLLIPTQPIAPGKKFTNPNYVKTTKYFPKTMKDPLKNYVSSRLITSIKENCPEAIPAIEWKNTMEPKLPIQSPTEQMPSTIAGDMVTPLLNTPLKEVNVLQKEMEDSIENLPPTELLISKLENVCLLNDEDKERKDLKSSEQEILPCFEDLTPTCNTDDQDNNPFTKPRRESICESEDSFIVFDSDSCYEDDNSECGDWDSEDEEVIFTEDSSPESICEVDGPVRSSNKKVRFAPDEKLCKVHPMVHWSYAYQAARKGPWEMHARDRSRFNERINHTKTQIESVFHAEHRDKIFNQRFDN